MFKKFSVATRWISLGIVFGLGMTSHILNLLILLLISSTNSIVNFFREINKDLDKVFGKKVKKIFLITIIVLLISTPIYLTFFHNTKSTYVRYNSPSTKQNIPPIKVVDTPKPSEVIPEALVVRGSKTEVIVENNQDKALKLNITYKIHSNWFGIDSIQSKIFEIEPKQTKNFKVYDNVGCSHAPCSVSIIRYDELK